MCQGPVKMQPVRMARNKSAMWFEEMNPGTLQPSFSDLGLNPKISGSQQTVLDRTGVCSDFYFEKITLDSIWKEKSEYKETSQEAITNYLVRDNGNWPGELAQCEEH